VFHFWSPERGPGKSSIIGNKLPNSGNTLELQVPSRIWKYTSGWTNHSGMVTSLKASEKNVGNRGSKSVIFNNIAVKEQRVYGSWCGKLSHLRFTLMGLERDYQVKIPSNQIIQRRLYSTTELAFNDYNNIEKFPQLNEPWFITGFTDAEGCFLILIRKSPRNKLPIGRQSRSRSGGPWSGPLQVRARSFYTLTTASNLTSVNNPIMNPWFVTGFTDGEGCFWIDVYKDNAYKTGWRVKLYYQINLHKKDQFLLEHIQKFFKVGKLYTSPTAVRYYVSSISDLQVIIQHFDKYTLLSKKRADFELLKQAFVLVQNKEHLTPSGLEKIIAIKAIINKGLSEELKANFPKVIPVEIPVVENTFLPDPNWLAGFTSAEGCFLVRVYKSKTKTGEAVKLVFQLTQHVRDEQLMRSFIDYFNCGYICKSRESFVYRVENFTDIQTKIIPFFNKYHIQGVKNLDYKDFCDTARLIEKKLI